MKRIFCLLFSMFFLIMGVVAAAAAPVSVDIVNPGQRMLNLAMADPIAPGGGAPSSKAAELQQLISSNLSFLPFMRVIPPQGIVGGTHLTAFEAPNIDFARFKMAGADIVVTTGWVGNAVQIRAYEPVAGQLIVGKQYDLSLSMPETADRFCAALLESLTGNGDFFLSTLAFIKSNGKNKQVWIVKPTGRDLKQITNMPGLALSPAWSPDGRFIVFSQIDDRTHALGVWDRSTGKTQRIKFPGNTIIGPTFFPNNKIAVSLAIQGSPNIYMLNHAFQKEGLIESSSAIDVSPSLDKTGSKMAFTSDRLGNPHVFLKDLNGGSVRRVSMGGTYNTEPTISPDGTLVAYSRMTSNGHRIFVNDLLTGSETQVSFGPGSDEQPKFCTDSYFIAFSSSRSGAKHIYLITRFGGTPKEVPTGPGDAAFPAWGKIPTQ